MWDDFEIGEDFGNTAQVIDEYTNFSANKKSYWWQGMWIGGRIEKSSTAGKHITRMIERGVDGVTLDKQMLCLGIEQMPANKIADLLFRVSAESFDNGRVRQAEEIRDAINYPR